jgi:hypothetical protein
VAIENFSQLWASKPHGAQQQVLSPNPAVAQPKCFMLGRHEKRFDWRGEFHHDSNLARRQDLPYGGPRLLAHFAARGRHSAVHIAGQRVHVNAHPF